MTNNRLCSCVLGAVALFVLGSAACNDDDDDDGVVGGAGTGGGGGGDVAPDDFEELDMSVCDLDSGPFSLDIDNPYFPLPVGQRIVLEGDDQGTIIRVEITVLDEVETVGGVETRVMEEAELEDEELVEVSRNFFAQASDGTVCYFGEDVDDYEGGVVVSHGGAWRAGDGDNAPGIFMPGTPREGTRFFQERAPDVAEDVSAVLEVGSSFDVATESFEDVVVAVDWNPLDGQTSEDGDEKVYARGVGLVFDEVVELIEVVPAGS
ncbi:MAG: hypothetical protein HOW73_45305 [Polyangiaceae bacterium]|nr:hypothetical protein [Polyangiaceae bacterium]